MGLEHFVRVGREGSGRSQRRRWREALELLAGDAEGNGKVTAPVAMGSKGKKKVSSELFRVSNAEYVSSQMLKCEEGSNC